MVGANLCSLVFTTLTFGMTVTLTTSPTAPPPPDQMRVLKKVAVGARINATGNLSWDVNLEGSPTAVSVYWLLNSENPPNWPGGNPGIVVDGESAILYNRTTRSCDYTLLRTVNGVTTDIRITATKNLTNNTTYYVTAEPFGATAPYRDANGNPIFASAGGFTF